MLTTREFDLLAFFLNNPGQVFSRKELLADVWGWTVGDESTVTVHVRRLRGKLEDDPAEPRRVVTVWGSGYRYQPQEQDVIPAADVGVVALLTVACAAAALALGWCTAARRTRALSGGAPADRERGSAGDRRGGRPDHDQADVPVRT